MGSIIERPRHDGTVSYQAMVKIPGAKAAVKSFPDRQQAQAFVDEIEKERETVAKTRAARWIHPLSASETEKKNQEDWANEWLITTLKLYLNSGRIANRSANNTRTVLRFVGDVKLGELNKAWVRKYIAHARKQLTRSKKPYTWATIVDHIGLVSAAMNWRAEEMEAKGAKLPFSLRMVPKDWERKRDRRLSPLEERRIIVEIKSRIHQDSKVRARHFLRLFRLALNTAARLQELVLAEWQEFNLEQRFWIMPAAHTKCKKTRVVPLTKQAVRVLRAMQLIRAENSNRVFHLIDSSVCGSRYFFRITERLGLDDLRFHDLRHEAISRMVLKQRQLSVFEIMSIVGHSSIEMLKRYSNLRGDELAAKLID